MSNSRLTDGTAYHHSRRRGQASWIREAGSRPWSSGRAKAQQSIALFFSTFYVTNAKKLFTQNCLQFKIILHRKAVLKGSINFCKYSTPQHSDTSNHFPLIIKRPSGSESMSQLGKRFGSDGTDVSRIFLSHQTVEGR